MNSRRIHKVLIANRGEIAVRVIKTLRKLHLASVAVFADNDANALHRRMADEAYPLGCGALKDTYLNIQKIIDAALDTGADAIHPHFSEVITPGGSCALAHKAGIEINTWTVNRPEDMRAVLKEGADILITNHPDVGLQCLAGT